MQAVFALPVTKSLREPITQKNTMTTRPPIPLASIQRARCVMQALANYIDAGSSARALARTSRAMHHAVIHVGIGYWRARLRAVAPHLVVAHDDERTCFWLWVRWTTTHRPTVCAAIDRLHALCADGTHVILFGFVPGAPKYRATQFTIDPDHVVFVSAAFNGHSSITTEKGCAFQHKQSDTGSDADTTRVVGTTYPASPWALPARRSYRQVHAGTAFCVGWLDDRTVVAWNNDQEVMTDECAPLRDVRFVQLSVRHGHMIGVCEDGTCRGFGADDHGQVSGGAAALPPGRRYVQVSAGDGFSVGLLDDGTCVAWGRDAEALNDISHGRLPPGHHLVQVVAVQPHGIVGLFADGTCGTWFSDDRFWVVYDDPSGNPLVKVDALVAGISIGVLDDGTLMGSWNVLGDDVWRYVLASPGKEVGVRFIA